MVVVVVVLVRGGTGSADGGSGGSMGYYGNGEGNYGDSFGGGSTGGGTGGPGAGMGGYGIVNFGTITTLSNLQGTSFYSPTAQKFAVNGLSVTTIPLYIDGNAPTNYNIIIDDNTSRYGQLYANNNLNIAHFDIDASSVINLTAGSSKTYTNVLSNITTTNVSGTKIIGAKTYNWTISNNNLTITNSVSSCYNKGTTVLCLVDGVEKYVCVENLKPTDMVKTYKHGFKSIEIIGKGKMMNNPRSTINCMYRIKKFDNMTHDLEITGQHFLLVDSIESDKKFYKKNIKIDDKFILMARDSKLARPIRNNNTYTIYLLALKDLTDKSFGIYVNGGLLSESTTKMNIMKHSNNLEILK